MRKRAIANIWIDRFHRGFVWTCLTVTVCGTILYGTRFVHYFTVIKPEQDKRKLLEQRELLSEGAYDKIMEDPYAKSAD
ncbi:uncharacterized protein LOC123312465 [Coccinella septempunctata]|uniref:uncharacterized protein LOC123312465 n=1 Tax=Coccinella septempunctata TaxID=41139 RepID=UPI001D06B5CC|nr:uncharacterized protein LOC123312465 [Coccinella septempunctata]